MTANDGIVTTRITITRHYHPNREQPADRDTVTTDAEGGATLVEYLGLLEMARADFIAQMVHDEGPDND